MTTITDLKQAHRATWAAGDYAAVARHIDEAPPSDLIDRVEVRPGEDVLDLTPELFTEARRRASAAGVAVDWVRGDAEELPFADGSFDPVLSVMGGYMPAPPAYASPPPLWGSEEHVKSLFEGTGVQLEFSLGSNPWRFDSAGDWVGFMETRYGPTIKARERLSGEGRWEECRGEVVAMAERRNAASDGSLLLWAEYLVVTGRKAV